MPHITEQTNKYLRQENVRSNIRDVAKHLRWTSGCSPDRNSDHDARSISRISAKTAKYTPKFRSKSEEESMRLALRLLCECAEIGLAQSESDTSESDSGRFAPGMSTPRRNNRSAMSGSQSTDYPSYSEDWRH